MDMVKKNILSIICGVVALAALIFHFVVTSGGFSTLEAQATARAAKQAELKQLLSTEFRLPTVSDGEPPKLSQFPNEKIIESAKVSVSKLSAQASAIVTQAVAMNKSGYFVIVPDTLPVSSADQRKFEYRDQYNQVLKRDGKPKTYDNRYPVVNLPDGVLQSATPPTDAEIQAAKLKLWEDEYKSKLIMIEQQPGVKVAFNQKEVVSEYLKAIVNFDEQFRRNRALSYKVYLEPNALTISPRLEQAISIAPALEDIWYGQMSLWVQLDVCNAIARMNAKSPNIPSSPVKHLVALDVRQDASMYVGVQASALQPLPAAAPAAPAEGEEGAPAEAPAAPAGPSHDFALSPTGRVCNPLYDVVQFELVVVLDRSYVRDFIRQLQSGRFITVLESDMQNIDLDEAVSQGYDYGNAPVIEAKIKCEILFMREWTAHNNGPMPIAVRRMLNVVAPPAAAPPNAVVQQ